MGMKGLEREVEDEGKWKGCTGVPHLPMKRQIAKIGKYVTL